MAARPRSWWQKARKPLEVLGIAVVCMLVMALLVAIVSWMPSRKLCNDIAWTSHERCGMLEAFENILRLLATYLTAVFKSLSYAYCKDYS